MVLKGLLGIYGFLKGLWKFLKGSEKGSPKI